MIMKSKLPLALLFVSLPISTTTAQSQKGSISVTVDDSSGVLSVQGDDTNNTILVAPTVEGIIEVNGGTVPIVGGRAYADKIRLVVIRGGGGPDRLSVGGVPAADFNGGSEDDVYIWIDPDPSVVRDGEDLLVWTDGDNGSSDYNDDGVVTAADYTVRRMAIGEDALYLTTTEEASADQAIDESSLIDFGTTSSSSEMSDGSVDFRDFRTW